MTHRCRLMVRCGLRATITLIARVSFSVSRMTFESNEILKLNLPSVVTFTSLSRLEYVQAMLLMGYREIGLGTMAQAWLYLGVAIRSVSSATSLSPSVRASLILLLWDLSLGPGRWPSSFNCEMAAFWGSEIHRRREGNPSTYLALCCPTGSVRELCGHLIFLQGLIISCADTSRLTSVDH